MIEPDTGSTTDLATLHQMVAMKQPTAGSTDALKELARRTGPEPLATLGRILADATYPEEMRTTAAVALGRRPGAEATLMAALVDPSPAVVRRAAESLGRTGTAAGLKALEITKLPEDPPARRALLFARRLASARLAASSGRAETDPAKLQPLHEKMAASLAPRSAEASQLELLHLTLEKELPALPVSSEGAVQLTCGNNRFLVLPHRDAARSGRSDFVPAVVLKRAQALDRYALYLYVLSTPRDARTLLLEGFRPDGTLTCRGEARLGDGPARFTLGALDTPHTPPLRIEGHLADGARLVIETALVGPPDRGAGPRARTPAPAIPTPLKAATAR
jgi:hypothetical protein